MELKAKVLVFCLWLVECVVGMQGFEVEGRKAHLTF